MSRADLRAGGAHGFTAAVFTGDLAEAAAHPVMHRVRNAVRDMRCSPRCKAFLHALLGYVGSKGTPDRPAWTAFPSLDRLALDMGLDADGIVHADDDYVRAGRDEARALGVVTWNPRGRAGRCTLYSVDWRRLLELGAEGRAHKDAILDRRREQASAAGQRAPAPDPAVLQNAQADRARHASESLRGSKDAALVAALARLLASGAPITKRGVAREAGVDPKTVRSRWDSLVVGALAGGGTRPATDGDPAPAPLVGGGGNRPAAGVVETNPGTTQQRMDDLPPSSPGERRAGARHAQEQAREAGRAPPPARPPRDAQVARRSAAAAGRAEKLIAARPRQHRGDGSSDPVAWARGAGPVPKPSRPAPRRPVGGWRTLQRDAQSYAQEATEDPNAWRREAKGWSWRGGGEDHAEIDAWLFNARPEGSA